MGVHILENEYLKVTVADAGAELASVIDKASDAERIWNADPTVWNRHAPILFPFVGRVAGGEYRIDGKAYPMKTQHGFARDMDFTCTEKTDISVTHCLTYTDSTLAVYPYKFRLTVTHAIEGRVLTVGWKVDNLGGGLMYYSIGGHPGFMLPAPKADCYVAFPDKTELEYFSVGGDGLALPDTKYNVKPDNGYVPIDSTLPDTWVFSHQGIDTVGLALPDKSPYVTMRCEGFPLLAVWAKEDGPFVCLEPWYGRTDDSGFTGTLADKPEVQTLNAGDSKVMTYSVEFHG